MQPILSNNVQSDKNTISIDNQGQLEGMIPLIKQANQNKLNLTCLLQQPRGSRSQFKLKRKFIRKLNKELRHKGVAKIYFSADKLDKFVVLQCFANVCPQRFTFYITDSSENLNNKSTIQIFESLKMIKPQFFSLNVRLERLSKIFFTVFYQEAEKISLDLDYLQIHIKYQINIFEAGLNSFKVLQAFEKFNSFWLTLPRVKCPKSFAQKIVFVMSPSLAITLNYLDFKIAFLLCFKGYAKKYTIQLKEIVNTAKVLPLFFGSNDVYVTLTTPEKKLSRFEFKAVLKYKQFFSYSGLNHYNKLPATLDELSFLEKRKMFCAFRYL